MHKRPVYIACYKEVWAEPCPKPSNKPLQPRLLRDYGVANQPNPTSKQYVLIPLIGTGVAIAGYVLAKSGLLLLSSGGADTSLSPFMISLVGIVSGLLAKEMNEVNSSRGRKMLSGNGT